MIVRRTSLFFLGLLAVVIIALFVGGGTTARIYFRLAYGIGLLLAFSWIWTSRVLRHVEVNRHARSLRYQVGQTFEERFEIRNRGRLRIIWLEVRDLSPLPGKNFSRVLSEIGGGEERFFVTRTILRRRGAFPLGPTMLVSGDPFGLFATRREFPAARTLLVLPYMVEIASFPAPLGRLPGGRALQRRSTEVTPYAAGVREYLPGDPLNRIHWRSTARHERLMVKEFEQDPYADVWLFLDACMTAHISREDTIALRGQPFWIWMQRLEAVLPPSTFEYAVAATASVGQYYLRHERAVGLACASQSLSILPAERGERQLDKLLEMLAFVQPNGRLPLLGLVQTQASFLVRGTTVVVITAANEREVALAVEELLRRDLNPILIVVDRTSFGGQGDITPLREQVQALGVPVFTLRKDEDLRTALESHLPGGQGL